MIGTIAGLALTAAGSIWGAVSSSRASKQAQQALDAQHIANQAYYNREYNSDYAQRADVQAILTKQRDLLSDAYKRARAINVVAGGTDESLAMAQESANRSLASAMSNMAVAGANYKDNIASQRLAEQQAYATGQANIYNQRATNIAKAASGVTQAGSSLMSADESSWKEDKDNWGWLFGGDDENGDGKRKRG